MMKMRLLLLILSTLFLFSNEIESVTGGRVKEETMDSFDGLYFDPSSSSSSVGGRNPSSSSSSQKRTKGSSGTITRWPIFDNWATGNIKSTNSNNDKVVEDSPLSPSFTVLPSSSSSLSSRASSSNTNQHHSRDSTTTTGNKHNNRDNSVTAEYNKESQNSDQSNAFVDNIKCHDKSNNNNVQSLTARISPPAGFSEDPVFEDATSTEECSMKAVSSNLPNQRSLLYEMKISSFIKCGVTTQKANDGKEYLAVSIRFPHLAGLKTSDDEHVLILCRPQEKTVSKTHALEVRSNLSSAPRAVYSSGPHEFDTKIHMFTRRSSRSSGDSSSPFSEELSRNSLIEVGQDLQFRAVVRSGDGWRFAKLKDLTIQKISNPNKVPFNSDHDMGSDSSSSSSLSLSSSGKNRKTSSSLHPDSAYLVMEDGCRNPIYTIIAPKHPYPDSGNPLVVNFAFKAFMFQDMMDGDTLRITAKIMACQDKVDCQPGLCLDDELGGHGRRRRRSISDHNLLSHHQGSNFTHDWVRDFELRVALSSSNPPNVKKVIRKDSHRPIMTPLFATSILVTGLVVTTLVIVSVVSLLLILTRQQ